MIKFYKLYIREMISSEMIEKTFLNDYYQQSFQTFLEYEFSSKQSLKKSPQKKYQMGILHSGTFHPLTSSFQHYVKKFNLHFLLIQEKSDYFESIHKEIEGEECESHIQTLLYNPFFLSEKCVEYDYFIIHHTSIYDKNLIELLKELYKCLRDGGKIYFFYSVCNQPENKVWKKNFFREQVQYFTQIPVGKVKNIFDILDELNQISHLYKKIICKPFQKKTYPFFGDHIIQIFSLQKI